MNNSGYTSISIKGEEIELRFGIPAVRMFLEKIANSDITIDEQNINETSIAYLLYCGYINNCMVKDIVPTKTKGFFLEYVEESYVDEHAQKIIQDVTDVYANSKYTQKMIANAKDRVEEIKKKSLLSGMK